MQFPNKIFSTFVFRHYLSFGLSIILITVSQSFKNSNYSSFSRPGFERASRKARDLADKYNLGNPVAGNLFQAEHEG